MCGMPDIKGFEWLCDTCLDKLSANEDAKICERCYIFCKAHADDIIKQDWARSEDLDPEAEEIKQHFLQELEIHKP